MKRFVSLLIVAVVTVAFTACGDGKQRDNVKFAGTFTDEFNNTFVLNDDYTGTIHFDGVDRVDTILWSDGQDHKRPFATIRYNGDPTYYYLRDGALYRHEEDMDNGRCAIRIEYAE